MLPTQVFFLVFYHSTVNFFFGPTLSAFNDWDYEAILIKYVNALWLKNVVG